VGNLNVEILSKLNLGAKQMNKMNKNQFLKLLFGNPAILTIFRLCQMQSFFRLFLGFCHVDLFTVFVFRLFICFPYCISTFPDILVAVFYFPYYNCKRENRLKFCHILDLLFRFFPLLDVPL
jgi:hypothetical protein